jgi:DNA invertase Pin-like site-specific DNA recombinase
LGRRYISANLHCKQTNLYSEKKKKKKNFVLPCSTQHKQRRRRILLPVIRGVKEDVKNLSSTLSTIKAVLEDAENKQGNDPQLKIIDIMKFR